MFVSNKALIIHGSQPAMASRSKRCETGNDVMLKKQKTVNIAFTTVYVGMVHQEGERLMTYEDTI